MTTTRTSTSALSPATIKFCVWAVFTTGMLLLPVLFAIMTFDAASA